MTCDGCTVDYMDLFIGFIGAHLLYDFIKN